MRAGSVRKVRSRELGAKGLAQEEIKARDGALQLNLNKRLKPTGRSGITWLDLEAVESRYLLVSSFDSAVSLYDVLSPTSYSSSSSPNVTEQEHVALGKVDKNSTGGHKFTVSCVAWYPVDTGLFLSCSYDNQIKVWDTELLKHAVSFHTPSLLHAIALSKVATSHCLTAAAGADALVRLCDISSGAFTHTLTGHRQEVWALQWSQLSEWILLSGGCDGEVRLWDIRMSGCTALLDQHYTAAPSAARKRMRREQSRSNSQPLPSVCAHDGSVTSILPSPNSLLWLTAGTDGRVRQWDSFNHRNMLINFANTFNRATKPRQMATAQQSDVLYHPSGSVIQMLRIGSGNELGILRGHMDTVHACAFNPVEHELYTGGSDCQLLVWSPPSSDVTTDEDNWSDSD